MRSGLFFCLYWDPVPPSRRNFLRLQPFSLGRDPYLVFPPDDSGLPMGPEEVRHSGREERRNPVKKESRGEWCKTGFSRRSRTSFQIQLAQGHHSSGSTFQRYILYGDDDAGSRKGSGKVTTTGSYPRPT